MAWSSSVQLRWHPSKRLRGARIDDEADRSQSAATCRSSSCQRFNKVPLWIDPGHDVVIAFVSNRHSGAEPDEGIHTQRLERVINVVLACLTRDNRKVPGV